MYQRGIRLNLRHWASEALHFSRIELHKNLVMIQFRCWSLWWWISWWQFSDAQELKEVDEVSPDPKASFSQPPHHHPSDGKAPTPNDGDEKGWWCWRWWQWLLWGWGDWQPLIMGSLINFKHLTLPRYPPGLRWPWQMIIVVKLLRLGIPQEPQCFPFALSR